MRSSVLNFLMIALVHDPHVKLFVYQAVLLVVVLSLNSDGSKVVALHVEYDNLRSVSHYRITLAGDVKVLILLVLRAELVLQSLVETNRSEAETLSLLAPDNSSLRYLMDLQYLFGKRLIVSAFPLRAILRLITQDLLIKNEAV